MPKYKIPIKDSLVCGHVDPDGDSLSSTKAVINYLRSHGKTAVAKICGTVPEHLSWILSEEDLPPDIPKIEQTIVLDCGPTPDRVGFEIKGPIFNIDHHLTRIEEHNPRKKSYILDRCSTAAALILDFGVIDPILLVGLYTDTFFQRSWNELQSCFKKIPVADEKAEQMLSAIRPVRYMQTLIGIKSAKFHKCRNGFLIVETAETDSIVINEMMDTLFRYSESVCLVAGNGMAKLRTSNKALIDSEKMAKIASIFDGGGHPFAAMCQADGKRTALFGAIKQLSIIENKVYSDGYEGEKK